MKIFVSEFVCGGGWPDERIELSLAREGRAMLLALIEDLTRSPKIRVVTTWDVRLGECPIRHGEVSVVQSSQQETNEFRRLVSDSDAVWVIAPETGGILEQRQALAFEASIEFTGGRCRVIGTSNRAIRVTADKWRASQFWAEHRIATPTTRLFDPRTDRLAWPYPIVIKPRDGAGSLNTFLIRDEAEWHEAQRQLVPLASTSEFIQQPYVAGRALSVAMLLEPDGSMLEILPVAEQRLSDDGRFHYLGGRIPAAISDHDVWRVTDVASRGVRVIPGIADMAGYIGCDVVLPDDSALPPQLIEINPRLTSSYLGYRQLTDGNIPAQLLGLATEPLRWKKNQIEFAV